MPGRSPHEAVEFFLQSFRDAVGVLEGFSRIVVSQSGGYRKGQLYSWMLNGPEGMELGDVGVLRAAMWFEVVDADPAKHDKPYRVTTRGYNYWLTMPSGQDAWRVHWHPTGNSDVSYPHVHPMPSYGHFLTPRLTFETIVQWCMEMGAPLTCTREEADNFLALVEAPHLLHRTWSDRPDEPHD
jgi:hypothetical protein